MQLSEYSDVLTVSDLMKILKIGKNTVYRLLKENTIRSPKIGRSYRIPKKYVTDFLLSAQKSE